MKRLNPAGVMLFFGFLAIGGLSLYLMLYHGSPGPLAAPHAAAIRGTSIRSCKQCHTKQGLADGCLHCHVEIAAQLDSDTGYHAHLLEGKPTSCEQCHLEHNGADFLLVGAVAWKGLDRENFDHPHVDFILNESHDTLSCDECHVEKRTEPYALPDFPNQKRPSTFLGLEQSCVSCHEDVHGSGEATRQCSKCHDQNKFKPAAFFNHDEYFLLEGIHATTECADCHRQDDPVSPTGFGPVKGKACIDCHESPHRFEETLNQDCQTCHLAADENWELGRRGVDPQRHASFGFALEPPHADRTCESCHKPELPYGERFPDPGSSGYMRQPDQCRGCHADPHAGQFLEKHPGCLECHQRERFVPSMIGLGQHSETYPLQGAHQAVACIECHTVDQTTDVRQFAATPTDCKACHADPHEGQFNEDLRQGDCTACHLPDSSTFRIPAYQHQSQSAFFQGKRHQEADCRMCHAPTDSGGAVVYQSAPTACSSCHTDVHRGQLWHNGQNDCERCHDSTEQWITGGFIHDRDARFALEGAHVKVACAACHLPVPQPDGKPVVQYRPLTTRCEDCHGFISK